MPKENISSDDGRVSVAWSPGEDVQVRIEQSPVVTINGEMVTGMSVTAGGPSAFATLDRAGINRMIRSLRKARDAAFGADA